MLMLMLVLLVVVVVRKKGIQESREKGDLRQGKGVHD